MKIAINKCISFLCACVIAMTLMLPVANAKDIAYSGAFARTLNAAMLNCGIIRTDKPNGFIDISNTAPTGVIYADTVTFENGEKPCLIVVYSDGVNGSIAVDIYRYDGDVAELVTTIRKPYDIENGHIGEVALAEGGDYRYIVYNEYNGDTKVCEEYYTVISNYAFSRVSPPEEKTLFGIASFTDTYIHPEVDVSNYNHYLTKVFSEFKDGAAKSVTYNDILYSITEEEHNRLSRVLSRTAEFTDQFDIGEYSQMSEYSLAVNKHEGNGKFNAITNVYDLGDELYYIRYSTDLCFYNGTIVRRTDKVTDNYQILNVQNDCIPFMDNELKNLKTAYMKNRLVLEKSQGSMELKNKPIIEVNRLNFDKHIDMPQMVSPNLRKPLALIGGGVILGLFILLWVYLKE